MKKEEIKQLADMIKDKGTKIIVQFSPGAKNKSTIRVKVKQYNNQFDRCTYGKGPSAINFWAFRGTIRENERYAAVNLPIPLVLLGKNPTSRSKKYKHKGLFLLQPKDNSFLDSQGGDHGQYNCPGKPTGSGAGSGDKADRVKDYFKFNLNYFYPLISSNWQTFYHVTELKGVWDEYDPCCQNISVDFPIQYDSALGIYYTREVSFVPKEKDDPCGCDSEECDKCEEKYIKKKRKELSEILFPKLGLDRVEELLYESMEKKKK